MEQFKEAKVVETEARVLTMIDEFKQRTFIEVNYKNEGLDQDVDWLLIKQLIKESLTNAARYSTSEEVLITLFQNVGYSCLRVYNEGKYDPSVKIGNGIRGMKERLINVGGKLEIEINNGFEILCCLPREANDD